MMEMEFRLYTLSKPLKATDTRIALIRAGKVNVDKLISDLDCERSGEKFTASNIQSMAPKALPPPDSAICRSSCLILTSVPRDGSQEGRALHVRRPF